MYYVRYTQNPQADLERGYSFESYVLMASVEDVMEHFGIEESGVAIDNVTGKFGLRLAGLCGYSFETIEEARDFIANQPQDAQYNGQGAIFMGEFAGNDEDGVCFHPLAIVELF